MARWTLIYSRPSPSRGGELCCRLRPDSLLDRGVQIPLSLFPEYSRLWLKKAQIPKKLIRSLIPVHFGNTAPYVIALTCLLL